MSFLNPIGLIGLLSLPVILALHLLRKRQQRYVVSHLGLWSFLDTEARGPRTRRIPITWILVLDLLIAALLSLAWSQPRLTLDLPGQRARHLVVLLDVSSSMRAADGSGLRSRFDEAKAAASTLVSSAGQADVVTVLTFGQQARLLGDSRTDSLNQITDRIAAAQVGETGSALREALALGQSSVDGSLPAEFHVITDGGYDQPRLVQPGEFAYPLRWRLIGDGADNQAVIDLNTTPLGGNRLQVFARIANFGSQGVTRAAALEVNGELMDLADIYLPADSSVPQVWQVAVEAADQAAEADQPAEVVVSLRGTDPLAEDDSAVVSLPSGGSIRVALVADEPAPVQQAVQAIPGVELDLISPEQYASGDSSQSPFDLTIFRGYLPETWPAGQVLVVEPPAGVESGGVSLFSTSSQEIPANTTVQIASRDPLVEGIDFNGVRWARAWALDRTPPGFVPLLQANDVPILLQGDIQQQPSAPDRVVLLLADLSQGNFTKHPAFPILIANLVDSARQTPLPPGIKTGEAVPLPAPGSIESIQVTTPAGDAVDLGQNWPAEWTQTLDPGLYRFRFTDADGEVTEILFGARAGDEVESDIRTRDWTQTAAADPGAADSILVEEEQQIDLQSWLLGAAVLVLLLEAVLAWRR